MRSKPNRAYIHVHSVSCPAALASQDSVHYFGKKLYPMLYLLLSAYWLNNMMCFMYYYALLSVQIHSAVHVLRFPSAVTYII